MAHLLHVSRQRLYELCGGKLLFCKLLCSCYSDESVELHALFSGLLAEIIMVPQCPQSCRYLIKGKILYHAHEDSQQNCFMPLVSGFCFPAKPSHPRVKAGLVWRAQGSKEEAAAVPMPNPSKLPWERFCVCSGVICTAM